MSQLASMIFSEKHSNEYQKNPGIRNDRKFGNREGCSNPEKH
nr:hypothetical protein [Escherichia coli]UWM21718.1 hypothetical protein [Escherichia coli]UWM22379.1 hypothetical protein [Klebsiella pneumoniae]WDZ04178.1 hypothetical protein [Escherichia coli]